MCIRDRFVHWPEAAAQGSRPWQQKASFNLFLLTLDVFRRRGGKAAWIFHNKLPHSKQDLPMDRFAKRVDVLLSPSHIGLELATQMYPCLGDVPSGVSRLGRYDESYSTAPNSTPGEEQKLRDDQTVVINFGHIRRYKGLEDLLSAASSASCEELSVVVIGEVHDADYGKELEALSSTLPNVQLKLGFMDSAELASNLSAADAAVFSFTDVLHSSSLLLARSAGLPVLAPAIGSLPEYAELDSGLHLYEGLLTGEDLDNFAEQIGHAEGHRQFPADLEWTNIGPEIARLLEQVLHSDNGETP